MEEASSSAKDSAVTSSLESRARRAAAAEATAALIFFISPGVGTNYLPSPAFAATYLAMTVFALDPWIASAPPIES